MADFRFGFPRFGTRASEKTTSAGAGVSNKATRQRTTFMRLLRLLLPWRWWIVLSNILILISSALGIFSLVAMFPILKVVFASPTPSAIVAPAPESEVEIPALPESLGNSRSWLDEQKSKIGEIVQEQAKRDPVRLVYILCGVFVIATILRALVDYLSRACVVHIQIGFMKYLTHRIYRHAIAHDTIFFAWNSAGRLMQRIYNDVPKIGSLIGLTYGNRIRQPIEFVFLAILLLMIHFWLGLIILVALPIMLLPGIWIAKRIREISRKEVGIDANLMELMQEQFCGVALIKTMAAEDLESERFKESAEAMFVRRRMRALFLAMNKPIIETLTTCGVIVAIIAGTHIVLEVKWIKPHEFLFFLIVVSRLYKPLRLLSTLQADMQRPLMSAEAIFALLDQKPKILQVPNAADFPENWRTISFERVWFRYSKKKGRPIVLRDVNATLNAGESLALVGDNGSGKTTFASLLCRLYDPNGGRIAIDGRDLKEFRIDDLRRHIGVVHQQTVLFNLTIAQNISYGQKEDKVDFDRVRWAAEKAGAAKFIQESETGYDTLVGINGAKLSGGQRQLIALARILYHDPPIVIYDEPTTHLDALSEERLLEVLKNMMQDHTILLITHTPEHALLADRTIRFKRGEIVEETSNV